MENAFLIAENGDIIPEGVLILLSAYQVHHRPDLYPNPLEYRPERFSPENASSRHPYAFIPFSAGHRNCIGNSNSYEKIISEYTLLYTDSFSGQRFAYAEVKTMLANIFRNFTAKTVAPCMEDLEVMPELVLRPKDGIHIQFKPRNRSEWVKEQRVLWSTLENKRETVSRAKNIFITQSNGNVH